MRIWILWTVVAVVLAVHYREKILADIAFAKKEPRKWAFQKWKDWGEPLLIAAILAILIRTFIIGP
ncbi:MAG TPA: hypothetical protein PK997_03455, partial [Candidatus Omnitrophota bacterium]|nr:hypothetical protein [Candidatus Omnitrophota bacterium]